MFVLQPFVFLSGGESATMKGLFTMNDVHKQYGISLKTPPYINQDITTPVEVAMYLYKPSDKSRSDPLTFRYLPSTKHQPFMLPNAPLKDSKKRERERPSNQGNHDDLSSGMINVPPKLGSGGHVTQMNDNRINIMYAQQQPCAPISGASLFNDMMAVQNQATKGRHHNLMPSEAIQPNMTNHNKVGNHQAQSTVELISSSMSITNIDVNTGIVCRG